MVLKSTRALKRIEVNRLIDFSLAFSEPTQRADSDEKHGPTNLFQVACPEPACRDRLWSGPTLFKRAQYRSNYIAVHVVTIQLHVMFLHVLNEPLASIRDRIHEKYK